VLSTFHNKIYGSHFNKTTISSDSKEWHCTFKHADPKDGVPALAGADAKENHALFIGQYQSGASD
jgi:hypothetical protein